MPSSSSEHQSSDSPYFLVSIKNFQRIRSAKLVFRAGVNVIVGSSNNGKSSIFRALRSAIFNLPSGDKITLGETHSLVGIKYDRGINPANSITDSSEDSSEVSSKSPTNSSSSLSEVIWSRDSTKTSPTTYRVNGNILSKVGRNQNEEVAQALGIKPIVIQGSSNPSTEVILNFLNQMQYPFLLDASPSTVFKFIMTNDNSGVLEAQAIMRKDLQSFTAKQTQLEGARTELQSQINLLSQSYEESLKSKPLYSKVLSLDSVFNSFSSLSSLISTVSDLKSSLSAIPSIPLIPSIPDDSLVNSLSSLSSLLSMVFDIKSGIILKSDNLFLFSSYLSSLSNLPESTEVSSLSSLSSLLSQFDSINQNLESISIISIPELVSYPTELDSLLSLLSSYYSLQSQLESINLFQVNAELSKVSSELSQFSTCPYCGSQLS